MAEPITPERRRTHRLVLLSIGLITCQAPATLAQQVPVLINPGLQQQLELQQQQQQQAPDVQRGQPEPLIEEKAPGDQPLAPEATLLIRKVEISGARVVPASQIEAVFAPLLSTAAEPRPVRFAELQNALQTATNLYRSQELFISRVVLPRGAYQDGVLRVLAIEGFLEAVEVTGKGSAGLQRWSRFYLQPLLSTGAQPRPIRFNELERQLLLMQGFGGVRFKSSLTQGSSFGGSKLVIELNPQTLSGAVSLDNNVQPLLGDFQLTAQLQANVLTAPQPLQINLFGGNAFPYPGGLTSGAFSLATPLGNRGLRLVGVGSYTSTSSTTTAITGVGGAPLSLSSGGESWLGNLALRYPLLLSRRGSLGLSLAGEVQNTTSNTYLDSLLALSNPSRLRVLRLGVDGTLSSPFYASSANLQISQGLPIAQAYDGATLVQSGGSLPAGGVDYTSARLTLRHQQRLGSGNTFVTGTASGQVTSSMLPAPEDFSYGGPFLGRAYRGPYLVGDQGAAAGVELCHGFYKGPWTLTPFVFGDYGVASNNGRVPAPANYQASSYGIGLRGSWSPISSFELGWAIPSGGFPESTGRAGAANSSVYFRASLTF